MILLYCRAEFACANRYGAQIKSEQHADKLNNAVFTSEYSTEITANLECVSLFGPLLIKPAHSQTVVIKKACLCVFYPWAFFFFSSKCALLKSLCPSVTFAWDLIVRGCKPKCIHIVYYPCLSQTALAGLESTSGKSRQTHRGSDAETVRSKVLHNLSSFSSFSFF